MAANRWRGRWILAALAGLFFVLTPWAGQLVQGREGNTGTSEREVHGRQANITVHQGRLSVDLKDADVREVLNEIGSQAGIAIFFESPPKKRVGTRFTDMELGKGLRRVLQLASLNYAIVYRQGPAGVVAIKEVRIFGDAGESTPGHAIRQFPASVARPPAESSLRPVKGAESEAGQRFREALERVQQQSIFHEQGQKARQAPGAPATGAESEAGQRFREALERAQQQSIFHQQGRKARQVPGAPATGSGSDAGRRLREALERARQQPD